MAVSASSGRRSSISPLIDVGALSLSEHVFLNQTVVKTREKWNNDEETWIYID